MIRLRPPARKIFLGLSLLFGAAPLLAPLAAQARDLPTPEPFEVGESPAGNYLSARVAEDEHDTLAASTFLREALRADPGNSDLIDRAFVATLANGDMDAAFVLAQKILKIAPQNASARLALTVRDFNVKNYAGARKLLAGNGPNARRDLTSVLLTAWSWVGSGDVKKAMTLIGAMSDPNFAVFRDFHAGLMLDVAGKTMEAGERLKAAYGLDQTTLRLVDAYARNLSRQGKNDEAKQVYLAFDKLQPRNPIVQAALADLAAGKKLEPMVKNVAAGAAEVFYGLGAYGLGSGSGRPGDEIAAIVFLRLALELAPDQALALDTLGEAYAKLKQFAVAMEVYDEVPETSPLRPATDIRIAMLLDAMGKSDEAIAAMKDLVAKHPDDVDALSALADLLRNHKQFAESAEAYSKVLALTGPDDRSRWAIYYFRGVDYERAKQWDKAENDLKTALELYPEQPLVLNYLGYSWVDQGLHLDEAFKMLRRAVELQPEDGYIVDSLGWAHYKLGHYDEAVGLLERAIELKPGDPTINDHLGDAYWRVGRKLDAQFQWNHARDLNPDPDDLPKILDKISHGLSDAAPAEEPRRPAAAAAADGKGG